VSPVLAGVSACLICCSASCCRARHCEGALLLWQPRAPRCNPSRPAAAGAQLKKLLSSIPEAPMNVECLMDDLDFRSTMTREKFEELAQPVLERAKGPLSKARAAARSSARSHKPRRACVHVPSRRAAPGLARAQRRAACPTARAGSCGAGSLHSQAGAAASVQSVKAGGRAHACRNQASGARRAQALAEAGVGAESLASVEVVGGSSRVPALMRILRDFFGREPSRTLNATECVSRGCALNCAMLSPIFRRAPPLTVQPAPFGL